MIKYGTAALLGCVSYVAITTGALAQEATLSGAASGEDAAIIVTGSRVILNGDDSPTPTTVLDVQQMVEVRPTTIADQLNDLPQFAGSQGQGTQAQGGSANGGNPNTQGNVLNLRNFGFTRNLILFDGHRVAPNSPNGTVDVDMIPQLLLKRVDVVTGGVSAVYGSDAVTGAVNFITDTKFNGFKAQALAGISQEGDGATRDIGVAWGGGIGDRIHLLASYQYRSDDGIDRRSSRAWGANRWQLGTLGTVNGLTTQYLVSQSGRPGASFGGTIASIGSPANPLANFYFTGPGQIAPVTGTGPRGTAPNQFVNTNVAGDSSGSYFDPSLKGGLEMHQAFGRLDFDITDGLKFYARGVYTDTENDAYAISNPTYQASNASNVHAIFVSNPYLPANIRNQMTANGTNNVTRFGLNRVFGASNDRQHTFAYGRNWSVDAGFNGSIGGWTWEASYIHSDNRLRIVQENAINGRKLAAALDAVVPTGGGSPVCYATTQAATASQYQGCVPLANIFGGTLTEAERDWIFDPLQVAVNTKMDDFEGYITGSPFSSWAGPVNIALSAQARKQSYEVVSASNPATLANPLSCTNLRLITCGPTSLEYFQAESLSRPKIAVSVKEAAFEALVPLLKDSAIARSLSVNAAARVTDYSTSGTVWTWKGGLDWSITDDLTFRATRSRDIRAPTMHELYAPQSVGNYNGLDQLLNVALDGASGRPNPAGLVASGNLALRPEVANSLTLGVVYRPSYVPGLSIAIDYYDIKVSDAIISLNGSDTSTQLDCLSSGGTSETCDLNVRAGTGVNCATAPGLTFNNCLTRVFNSPINIGSQYTRGVDVELNYRGTIGKMPFSIRGLATYQPKNVVVDGITGLETNFAGTGAILGNIQGASKWRATVIANVEPADGIRISVMERYRGPADWFPSYSGAGAPLFELVGAPNNIDAKWYTNLNVSFRAGAGEFFVNVQNLFNNEPSIYANPNSGLPGNNGVMAGDDPVGRYFTAGFRAKF